MTLSLSLVIWILALVCFGLAAIQIPSSPRVNLIALGLFLLTLWVVVR